MTTSPERRPVTVGDERPCPICQGRGITWDDEEYDGFYTLCSRCEGSGRFPIRTAPIDDSGHGASRRRRVEQPGNRASLCGQS